MAKMAAPAAQPLVRENIRIADDVLATLITKGVSEERVFVKVLDWRFNKRAWKLHPKTKVRQKLVASEATHQFFGMKVWQRACYPERPAGCRDRNWWSRFKDAIVSRFGFRRSSPVTRVELIVLLEMANGVETALVKFFDEKPETSTPRQPR